MFCEQIHDSSLQGIMPTSYEDRQAHFAEFKRSLGSTQGRVWALCGVG